MSEKRPRDNTRKEAKTSELRRLKLRLIKLEEENDRLKKEIRTLEAYKNETNRYIDKELDGIPVEDVIRGIDKKQRLKGIKDELKPACKKCLNTEVTVLGRPDGKTCVMCFKCGNREIK